VTLIARDVSTACLEECEVVGLILSVPLYLRCAMPELEGIDVLRAGQNEGLSAHDFLGAAGQSRPKSWGA